MGQKEARMCRYVMHVFCAVALSIFGVMGSAYAVSLGKVDVASHLGEPFYAEVPLGLDEGEVVSSIFVELASTSDYRILEVFRDQSLDGMRIDVKNDSRGSRVELTSTGIIDAPFFNLVLKVRQGRATHFKKYAVFLELPRSAQPNVRPVVSAPIVKSVVEASPVETPENGAVTDSAGEFKSFDGWARTGRYGPMVFGDTITTVAQRLRVDDRFTTKQVMVALFEKNKDKFGQENINLIKAGTYLDVPSASEVEQVSRSRALSVLKDHNSKWKALTQQTKYAKIKDAQENRYGKRVHMGEEASGVASKPLAAAETSTESVSAVKDDAVDSKDSSAGQGQNEGTAVSKNDPAIGLLQDENNQLKQRLLDMESKVAALSNQPSMTETLAASDARIKKLEIQLARQSGELEKAREQALAKQQDNQDGMGLMTWILLGFVGLLSIVAGYLAYALRGQRNHPVEQANATMIEPEMVEVDEVDEIEVEESLSEGTDFDKTIVASSDDFDHTMLDELPELTDEDTSEMEAFTEQEEEPDPNVDYLTEADVYMRYGMEDEAEKQVRMALRLREDNKDALVKLVQIRHARGNQAGVDETATTARSVLTGDSLASFTTAFELLGKDSPDGVSSLDDTMPPTEQEVPEAVVDDMNDAALEMDDFDLPEFSSEIVEEEASESSSADAELVENEENEGFDFEGLDFSTDDENVENAQLDSNTNDASELLSNDDSGDDFDLTGLDLLDDSEADVEESLVADDLETLVDSTLPINIVTEADSDDDVGFDLSDLEMSEVDASLDEEQSDSVASSIESGDFDKTVVMDWSSDTALLQQDENPGSESGADELVFGLDEEADVESTSGEEAEDSSLEFDLDSLDLDDEGDVGLITTTMAAPEGLEGIADQDDSEPEEHLASVEFDLDDLDLDLDAVEHDADLDAFTSTIQATLHELGVENNLDETSDGLDISLDDDVVASESNQDVAKDDFDFDASLELDDLLSDLEDLSEDDKKKS